MKLVAAGLSDVGRERDHNEDSYAVEDDLGLFIVADGMGGHQAGEVASALAISTVVDHVRTHPGGDRVAALADAARMANARVEVAQAKHFDFVVVNALFETALFDLKAIVHAQRLKYAAQLRHRSAVFQALDLC